MQTARKTKKKRESKKNLAKSLTAPTSWKIATVTTNIAKNDLIKTEEFIFFFGKIIWKKCLDIMV